MTEQMSITAGGMVAGWWVELPLEEDGAPVWARIEVVLPPEKTMEDRYALRLRRDDEVWWVKVSGRLPFPVCDVDPTVGGPQGG
ncbi:hypothetical protein [Pseudonocardia hydrocarbonoxydans]|uniref:hypothetical protein n=1 Tax=Pseudonocardia hydrocarbonoxydans TaxID=76726 RepID=UPI001141316F|nr:hypothetical protein [Pseudonocardia hydrocarbonoxydans]